MKLLVCTQERHAPNPHSCANGGGLSIAIRLEEVIGLAGLEVTVERSSCMSMCVNGPNIRLLPEGKNWHRVDMQKIDEILEFVQGIQR